MKSVRRNRPEYTEMSISYIRDPARLKRVFFRWLVESSIVLHVRSCVTSEKKDNGLHFSAKKSVLGQPRLSESDGNGDGTRRRGACPAAAVRCHTTLTKSSFVVMSSSSRKQ
jgi:hypothetical protein